MVPHPFGRRFPGRDFGPDASAEAIDPVGLQLRWFDRWLKGIDNGVDREKPVKIFVMGADAGPGRHRGHLPAPGPADVSDPSRKAKGPMYDCTSLQSGDR